MRHAWLFPIALVTLFIGCAAEAPPPEEAEEAPAAEEYMGSVEADPAHYAVEFENDAVRLVRVSYGPGEASVMHTHPESCSVSLSDATWHMALPDGTEEDQSVGVGEVMCGGAYAHLPSNSSSEAAGVILIEFKEGATAGAGVTSDYPDAVTADPEHYSVEFENDVARVLRIRYGPGEASNMHHHPANCAIFLGDQTTSMETPAGEIMELPASELGTVMCVDLDEHLPTNAGDGPLELVLLELKGRDTF
jgi:quercetin dioxygenase-like cupin family protein